jgi:hypothetical protein
VGMGVGRSWLLGNWRKGRDSGLFDSFCSWKVVAIGIGEGGALGSN